jgi:hypothetical protein
LGTPFYQEVSIFSRENSWKIEIPWENGVPKLTLKADLVIGDPEGIHGEEIPLLFKIQLRGDFSPMDPLGILDHQISPYGHHYSRDESMLWKIRNPPISAYR